MENVALDLNYYRILLVDDSHDMLDSLQQMLKVVGCKIVTAASRVEALAHLEQKLFHIAVIDVRLSEDDPLNRDGMQLAHDIRAIDPSMGIILMSHQADGQDVRKLIQMLPGKTGVYEVSRSLASRFIYKTDSELATLPQVVYEVFQDVVQINWKLRITDPRGVPPFVACNMHCSKLPQPSDEQIGVEVDELLRKLFAKNHRVDLLPIAAHKLGYSKAHVIQVDNYDAGAKGSTRIAKLGEHPLIEREIMRFREHIDRLSDVNRYPAALSPIHRTRTLGGMIYTFLGMNGRIIDLAQVYQYLNDQTKINRILTNLFDETLSGQRRNTRYVPEKKKLRDIYKELLRLNHAELVEKQEELLTLTRAIRKGEHAKKFYLRDRTGLLNPVEFAFTQEFETEYHETIIHGDLHGRNVLVDRRMDTWLIDFADMGVGPMLQDYITMETWLLVTTVDQVTWTALFTWAKTLFASPDEFFPELPDSLKLTAPIVKAHHSIMTLRRLAFGNRIGRDETRRLYLIGMLYTLLRLMASRFLPSIKRFHALICASLIAGLLSTQPH